MESSHDDSHNANRLDVAANIPPLINALSMQPNAVEYSHYDPHNANWPDVAASIPPLINARY